MLTSEGFLGTNASLGSDISLLVQIENGGKDSKDHTELFTVRPCGTSAVLRTIELRGRDQLHGAGDLLDVLNGFDACFYIE